MFIAEHGREVVATLTVAIAVQGIALKVAQPRISRMGRQSVVAFGQGRQAAGGAVADRRLAEIIETHTAGAQRLRIHLVDVPDRLAAGCFTNQ